ncbi:MAG: S8 family serine peptidase [Bacteroidota bacterium]
MKNLIIGRWSMMLVFIFASFMASAQSIGRESGGSPKEEKADFKIPQVEMPGSAAKAELVPGSYIVILKPEKVKSFTEKNVQQKKQFESRDAQAKSFEENDRQMKAQINEIASSMGYSGKQLKNVYTGTLTGFTVQNLNKSTSEAFLKKAKENPNVYAVGPDFYLTVGGEDVEVITPEDGEALDFAQAPSWGTNYTGWTDKSGSPYWAWVLDSGIDLNHPDLNVKTSRAKSTVGYTSSAEDDNGHGSHVAGIIAAKNNSIGTRGVAAGAWVVPVKVCNSSGSCAWSDVLEGLQHVAKYKIAGDVVNLSLGGNAPSWWDRLWNTDPVKMEAQIKSLAAAGVHMVFAAGNSNKQVSGVTPARINGTRCYTVSAMDWNYNIASFSNYGSGVDWAAPGVSIRSCYKNGGYAYMNGTSMAAPYVAGILLANRGTINWSRRLNTDKDGSKDKVAKK